MKFQLLFIFVFALLATSCKVDNRGINSDIIHNPATASGEVDTTMLPKIEFEEVRQEFGTITQGEKVTRFFNFENTGKSPLVITSAKAGCGCTVPSWPREPIPPGGKGEIKVVFDSDGKQGQIFKKVSVIANTQPATNEVAIAGNVIAPGG